MIKPQEIFQQFLVAHPPRMARSDAPQKIKDIKVGVSGPSETPIITSGLLHDFVSIYERQWKDYYLPQLLVWRKNPISAFDPALCRGDEFHISRTFHETDFSDWFAWLISGSNPAASLVQKAVLDVLFDHPVLPPGIIFKVEREVPVKQGHKGHAGLIDLLLTSERTTKLFVVENKTLNPSPEEVKKNAGYKSIMEESHYRGWTDRYVMLVPDPDLVNLDVNDPAFGIVSWSAISRSLRSLLIREEKALDIRNVVFIGQFISAIEGHILRFPVESWRVLLQKDRTLMTETPAILAMAVASSGYSDYLEEFYG